MVDHYINEILYVNLSMQESLYELLMYSYMLSNFHGVVIFPHTMLYLLIVSQGIHEGFMAFELEFC